MNDFHDRLLSATEAERTALLAVPALARGARGEIGRESYLAFLAEAYHHVKHTVPLLMLCGARLPSRPASVSHSRA